MTKWTVYARINVIEWWTTWIKFWVFEIKMIPKTAVKQFILIGLCTNSKKEIFRVSTLFGINWLLPPAIRVKNFIKSNSILSFELLRYTWLNIDEIRINIVIIFCLHFLFFFQLQYSSYFGIISNGFLFSPFPRNTSQIIND